MGIRARSVRRIIARTSVFLLLGAIVNVAVAWALSKREFVHGQWRAMETNEVMWWQRKAPTGFADVPSAMFRHRSFGATFDAIVHTRDMGQSLFIDEHAWRSRLGWPMRSMERTLWRDARLVYQRQDVITLSPRWPCLEIPGRLIWPGFAINTLFYAGILWLMFAAPFALRRRRRIKCGLCPACAYPVGASEICTECGKPVTPKELPV